MRDDLIGLILGCKCQGKCCCPEKDAPAQKSSGLFQQSGRGLPPPRIPEDAPLVLPNPSYETAQRPANYGQPHIPANDAEDLPAYLIEDDYAYAPMIVVADDGTVHNLGTGGKTVDHQTRTIRTRPTLSVVSFTRLRDGQERMIYNTEFWSDVYAVQIFASAGLGLGTSLGGVIESQTRTEPRFWYYEDGISTGGGLTPFTTFRSGQKVDFEFANSPPDGLFQKALAWRYRIRKVYIPPAGVGEPSSFYYLQELQALLIINTVNTWMLVRGVPDPAPGADQDVFSFPYKRVNFIGLPVQAFDTPADEISWGLTDNFTGFGWAQLEIITLYVPLVNPANRWLSPDGRIGITGLPRTGHHLLYAEETVFWPGGSYTLGVGAGGSWAAYRNATGTVLLLHLPGPGGIGGEVMRVDVPPEEDATTQTISAADFSDGVLGATFLGFDKAGPLMNSWPPQHALARITPVTEIGDS